MDVREKQVSERVADLLSLSKIDEHPVDIMLDINKTGERKYIMKAVSKELVSYMNKTKWLRISFKNERNKKATNFMTRYFFSLCRTF